MIIFTDIDDTLMKTKRKIQHIDKCTVGAYSATGEVLSYIEPFRYDFISHFLDKHLVVPVTARSFDSLNRVQINFQHEKIINFGAHILNQDNQPIADWYETITHQQSTLNIMKKVKLIEENFLFHDKIQLIKRIEFGHFVFLNFRNSHFDLNENTLFSQKLSDFLNKNDIHDFYFYITDRDVTMIPLYIKKELAVEFLLDKYNDMTSMGIGDNRNDFNFMHLCHFSIIPNDSSIATLLKEFI